MVLLWIFIAAISIELIAELAESISLIGRPIETFLNLLALLIWGGSGFYVALSIKEKPALRYALIIGSSLFVLSQFGNAVEEILKVSGSPVSQELALIINLFETVTRSLGWGIFSSASI